METVHVNLGARSYDIALGTGVAGVGPFARAALPKSALALVVSDANTTAYAAGAQAALDAHGFRTAVATVPAA
jgi:3-dehydroquinate synthase